MNGGYLFAAPPATGPPRRYGIVLRPSNAARISMARKSEFMLWFKAFHIVAVICWFAALFYLPRLFVYHAMSEDDISRERFKVMERKLYRGIATPSMIATVLLGAATATFNWGYYAASAWFWWKVALVIVMLGYHHLCGRMLRQFAEDRMRRSHVFFRWFNEFPVLLLIPIVLLAVLKPA